MTSLLTCVLTLDDNPRARRGAAALPARLGTGPVHRGQPDLRGRTRPNLVAKEWVLFAARVVDLPGQVKTSSTIEPAVPGNERVERTAAADGGSGRVPANHSPNSPRPGSPFRIAIKAELLARHLVELRPGDNPPHVPALGDKEHQAALLSHGMIDLKDVQFQKWLDAHELRRGKNESDLDFARRVFQVIKKNFKYEYKETMDRRTGMVCKLGRSDCGGLSSLFVAALRTSKIPARMLAGRWAQSDKRGDKLEGLEYHQWHVKSEFFAEGIGWVPVDMSAAVTQRGGKEFAHFGHDPGDFVVFHLDTDLQVDTIHFGKHVLTWLQSPMSWVTGDGKLEPTRTTQEWQVRSKKK